MTKLVQGTVLHRLTPTPSQGIHHPGRRAMPALCISSPQNLHQVKRLSPLYENQGSLVIYYYYCTTVVLRNFILNTKVPGKNGAKTFILNAQGLLTAGPDGSVRRRHQTLPQYRTLRSMVKTFGGGGVLRAAMSASLLWLDFWSLDRRVLRRFTCPSRHSGRKRGSDKEHSSIGDTHTYTHTPAPSPPWEDQCEWQIMTRMKGPDCAVCTI